MHKNTFTNFLGSVIQISYDNIKPIQILFKNLNILDNYKMRNLIEINATRRNVQAFFLNSFIIRCQANKEVFIKLKICHYI